MTAVVETAFPVDNNFNSHAHVERDRASIRSGRACGISTHTLTWSVTHWRSMGYTAISISTHTLTWSVTGVWRINTP